MVDTAAHLLDRVLPSIPIRQWVLSFPFHLRLLYSTHPQAIMRTLKIVLRAIETHLIRKAGLTRNGLLIEEADQPFLDLQIDDTLDQFGAASLQYRVILGANAGSRVMTLRNPVNTTPATTSKPFTVARDGFSLNAAVSCQAHQRNKLERLCRYGFLPDAVLN